MPTSKEIKLCIDSARLISEKSGRRDSRYYKKTWLSEIFGFYNKPIYPTVYEVESFSYLWTRYQPNIGPNEKAGEFLNWLVYFNISNVVDKQKLATMIADIEKRHAQERAAGAERGIRYHFTHPVDVAIKGLLPTIDEISNERIDWEGEPLPGSISPSFLIGGFLLHIIYPVMSAGTFIFLTFFDGYTYTAFNWLIAIPANIILSTIWPLYWLVIRWVPSLF